MEKNKAPIFKLVLIGKRSCTWERKHFADLKFGDMFMYAGVGNDTVYKLTETGLEIVNFFEL